MNRRYDPINMAKLPGGQIVGIVVPKCVDLEWNNTPQWRNMVIHTVMYVFFTFVRTNSHEPCTQTGSWETNVDTVSTNQNLSSTLTSQIVLVKIKFTPGRQSGWFYRIQLWGSISPVHDVRFSLGKKQWFLKRRTIRNLRISIGPTLSPHVDL